MGHWEEPVETVSSDVQGGDRRGVVGPGRVPARSGILSDRRQRDRLVNQAVDRHDLLQQGPADQNVVDQLTSAAVDPAVATFQGDQRRYVPQPPRITLIGPQQFNLC